MPPFIKQLQSKPEPKAPRFPSGNVAALSKAKLWLEAYIFLTQSSLLPDTSLHYTANLSSHFVILGKEKTYTWPFNLGNSFQLFSRFVPLDHIKCNLAQYGIFFFISILQSFALLLWSCFMSSTVLILVKILKKSSNYCLHFSLCSSLKIFHLFYYIDSVKLSYNIIAVNFQIFHISLLNYLLHVT